MRIFIFILSLITLGIITFIYIGKYRSAFEADQACHFEQISLYADLRDTGCDHDIETKQWILYQKLDAISPAKVIKRYVY